MAHYGNMFYFWNSFCELINHDHEKLKAEAVNYGNNTSTQELHNQHVGQAKYYADESFFAYDSFGEPRVHLEGRQS